MAKIELINKEVFMLKITIGLLCFLFFFIGSSNAQSRGIGVGIIAGQPTGLSLKIWNGEKNAIDVAVGWNTDIDSNNSSDNEKNRFYFHINHLTHVFTLFKEAQGKLPLYYGIGARFVNQDKARLAIRIPVGIAFLVTEAPIDIFLELAPSLDVAPNTEFNLDGAIGIRYFFN